MPGDTGNSRAKEVAANANPPQGTDLDSLIQRQLAQYGSDLDGLRQQMTARDKDGDLTPDAQKAAKQYDIIDARYNQLLNTAVQMRGSSTQQKFMQGTGGPPDPFVITFDKDNNPIFTPNKNFSQDTQDQQNRLLAAKAQMDQAIADRDSKSAEVDAQVKKGQLDVNKAAQEKTAIYQEAMAQIDRINAETAQANAATARYSAETGRMAEQQAGPIEAMRAAGAIGDAAVRGNLIPSMLPYMIPKADLARSNAIDQRLAGNFGTPIPPMVGAPMPPFDPTTVGGQTSANALASLTASQNTLPAVANFQAPRPAPSPVVAGASVQPVAAQPAAAPLAAPPSLEQILQSARAQVIGPNAPGYGGQAMPPVMAGRPS